LLIAHSAGASSSASDRILAWSASTGQLTDYGPGDIVGASGEGTVVTGFDGIPGLTWTSGPAGSPSSGTIALWDTTWMGVPDVAWSPDGSRLVLIAGDENANYMDAVLFPG
jgi:WD40 repeat protein